ncbi:MAG: methionine--tRNA ligase [bacterium]|nr:methionine--tRNA ligase [bacterium]
MKSFYITTTLPYVNAEPHIGFAYEILVADVIARNRVGEEVFFNTGTDEHGQKIFNAAEKAGEKVELYVERYAKEFENLKNMLGLSDNLKFIRTTSEDHIKAAQELWARCKKNDDIYEKEFEGLYCVGCERFLAERDMIDGKCSIHQTEPQLLKERNWFFKFKKYEEKLLNYLKNPDVIIPEWRREEAINFVQEGLEDFSISREKRRLSWGVPVPGDDTQVMYVWFDALTSYISTLGWPEDKDGNFKKFWEEGHTLQLAGKDQVRFQSLMWQAMLMSAGIKNTNQVFYHGFINSGGHKMSKSLGNVISPQDMVKRYGVDGTRYLLLRHVHPTDDTDITLERLDEWYDAGLANGLGNLVSRVLTMADKYGVSTVNSSVGNVENNSIKKLDIQDYVNHIWELIQKVDKKIQDEEPYKKYKTDHDVAINIVSDLCTNLFEIAHLLVPIMPKTAGIIKNSLENLKKPENLFPRKD